MCVAKFGPAFRAQQKVMTSLLARYPYLLDVDKATELAEEHERLRNTHALENLKVR